MRQRPKATGLLIFFAIIVVVVLLLLRFLMPSKIVSPIPPEGAIKIIFVTPTPEEPSLVSTPSAGPTLAP